MYIQKYILVAIFVILPLRAEEGLLLLDEIKCVVCGPAANTPFTDTDETWKRTLENQFIPLPKQIQAEIVKQQVLSEKMPLDPEAIGKYLDNIKKQLKVDEKGFEDLFSEVGRTLLEGIDWISNQYYSEFFLHYKFKSALVPTDDEINEYYNEYPEFVDGYYEIQVARVPYEENQRDMVKKQIEAVIKNEKTDLNVIWGNSLKIIPEDLSSSQEFVKDMQPGQINVSESEGMFELVKFIAGEPTRIKPLSERQSDIIEILNRKKMDSMLQSYNNTIKDFIDIIDFSNDKK